MPAEVGRVVALGASNLTRGFQTIVSTSRSVWGPDVEVLAALGHGRSYGAPSNFMFRTLPSILKSSLWTELASRPPMATRGLVTDVGNDILYGFSVERTLGWVEEALVRLRAVTNDIVLTDLPLASIRRLSNSKFLAFRSVLSPSCRLSLTEVIERAGAVSTKGWFSCLRRTGLGSSSLIPPGMGSIPSTCALLTGVRPGSRFSELSLRGSSGGGSTIESVKLYFMRPSVAGCLAWSRSRPSLVSCLRSGGQVWLY